MATGAKSLIGSYGRLALRLAATVCVLAVAMPIVSPSGAALATASAPILPLAPVRFSITICWPSRWLSFCATMRAMISVLLPAGKGTTKRTGRSGHPSSPVWAMAVTATIADANAIDSSRNIGKPRLRAQRRSGRASSCVQCFDVRATRSRAPPWTLQPIRARVHQAYGADVLERGHTHATDRHFPVRSSPRWRADGIGPARQGARRPHRRLGQPGKPPALAPHDHGGFLARCDGARICPRHVEDRPPRGRVSQSRRDPARAPHRRAGEEGLDAAGPARNHRRLDPRRRHRADLPAVSL